MRWLDFILITCCVIGMSVGQVLFKAGATRIATSNDVRVILDSVIFNGPLVAAIAVYLFATGLWVWLLMRVALTVAYPFMSLAFVVVPVLAWSVFGEPLTVRTVVGSCVIAIGVYITVSA